MKLFPLCDLMSGHAPATTHFMYLHTCKTVYKENYLSSCKSNTNHDSCMVHGLYSLFGACTAQDYTEIVE